MLKNQYISWIMFLVVIVTLFNLFYKPRFSAPLQAMRVFYAPTHPVSKSACPLQGLKCPPNEPCDCEALCSNGSQLIKFQVLETDVPLFVMHQRLTPGTYCLPRGVERCHHGTSLPMFSLAGWHCLPLNTSVFQSEAAVACQSDSARDNASNVLWDYKKNREAREVVDYYERFQGEYRYRCRCDSLSVDGVRMVSPLPFVCAVDACLREIPNPAPFMGWDGERCECGVYDHADPNDPTSPCRIVASKAENGLVSGRVNAMTKTSYVPHALLNPSNDPVLGFTVAADGRMPAEDYVAKVIQVTHAARNPAVEAFYLGEQEEDV